ncbi:MAG: BamA/TamA family outer membrane protein, partial [Bacteroidota bacterium]
LLKLSASAQTFQRSDTLRPKIDTTDRQVLISKIYILGNVKTKESIILRELNFTVGDQMLMSELKPIVARDEQKVFNLRLFNTSKITILETGADEVEILIQVTERWYTFPIPLFKLADRNFNDWWVNRGRDLSRVNYGLKLFKYNMRGRNERLRLVAQFGFTREFSLNYRIPYINKKQKEGLIFNFSFDERKNVAYNTDNPDGHVPSFLESNDLEPNSEYFDQILSTRYDADVTYSYRASFYSFHYVTLGFTSREVADTIVVLNPNMLGGGGTINRYFRLGYRFVRDLRDFVNYPLTGFYLRASTTKLGLGAYDDVDIWSADIQYSRYFDLKKGWYFSGTVAGTFSLPLDQPYAYNQALGFNRNLIRGYELDLIEGPRILLNKLNLKKQLFKKTFHTVNPPIDQLRNIPLAIYAKLFFDSGWVDNYPIYKRQGLNERLTNTYLWGLGAGIDIVTLYDFVIRPEFTYNSDRNTFFFLNFRADF